MGREADVTVGKRVLVAMSGGVDSSVAAALLQAEGYDCSGAILKLHDETPCQVKRSRTCCSAEDIEDARAVATQLGIDFMVLNHCDDFESGVIKRFVMGYQAGETPNPCIDCNRYIKFASFYTQSRKFGFDYLATGHYARVLYSAEKDRYLLKKAVDTRKDQSYVLYNLTQEQLAHLKLPLGEYGKTEIRALAHSFHLENAQKADSQDICFIPDGDYQSFLERYLGRPSPPGHFVDQDGLVLGRHRGIEAYTIGQRRGLGIAAKNPHYVIAKDMEKNEIVLGQEEALYHTKLLAEDLNWIAIPALEDPIHCKAKIRYSQTEQACVLRPTEEAGRVLVEFMQAQRAITRGQAVVFYDDDLVIGGGKICDCVT